MSGEDRHYALSRRTLLKASAAGVVGLALPTPESSAAAVRDQLDPLPSGLRGLWVIPHDGMSPAEQLLAQSLQGVTGRKRPRIWLRSGSMYAVIEEQLRREGVRLREAVSVWELLRQFRDEVKGAILCELDTPSVNVATSLCGLRDAVAVDTSLRERAEAAGLKVLVDARGMDEKQLFAAEG
jgi:hypothetical protein